MWIVPMAAGFELLRRDEVHLSRAERRAVEALGKARLLELEIDRRLRELEEQLDFLTFQLLGRGEEESYPDHMPKWHPGERFET